MGVTERVDLVTNQVLEHLPSCRGWQVGLNILEAAILWRPFDRPKEIKRCNKNVFGKVGILWLRRLEVETKLQDRVAAMINGHVLRVPELADG